MKNTNWQREWDWWAKALRPMCKPEKVQLVEILCTKGQLVAGFDFDGDLHSGFMRDFDISDLVWEEFRDPS